MDTSVLSIWSKHSASRGVPHPFTSQVQVLIAPQILVRWASFMKICCRSLYKEMLGDNGESLEVLCIYSIKNNTTKWIWWQEVHIDRWYTLKAIPINIWECSSKVEHTAVNRSMKFRLLPFPPNRPLGFSCGLFSMNKLTNISREQENWLLTNSYSLGQRLRKLTHSF